MAYSLVIGPLAEEDISGAVLWYRTQVSHQTAGRFLTELERTLVKVEFHPELYSYIDLPLRSARLQRFPYYVVFRIVGDAIKIFRVLHDRQQQILLY